MESREAAKKLQKILGDKYEVRFDDCESGLTRIFYKAKNGQMIFIKEVPNGEMKSDLSVTDFALPREKIMMLLALNNL